MQCVAQGIFVDEDGMVAEGPNMNLGIITHDNELVVSWPSFANSSGIGLGWTSL